jgi:hypothetical protein
VAQEAILLSGLRREQRDGWLRIVEGLYTLFCFPFSGGCFGSLRGCVGDGRAVGVDEGGVGRAGSRGERWWWMPDYAGGMEIALYTHPRYTRD